MHIDLTSSLNADVFILALRRLMSGKGLARSIWSGNGSNFVGDNNVLERALKEI